MMLIFTVFVGNGCDNKFVFFWSVLCTNIRRLISILSLLYAYRNCLDIGVVHGQLSQPPTPPVLTAVFLANRGFPFTPLADTTAAE